MQSCLLIWVWWRSFSFITVLLLSAPDCTESASHALISGALWCTSGALCTDIRCRAFHPAPPFTWRPTSAASHCGAAGIQVWGFSTPASQLAVNGKNNQLPNNSVSPGALHLRWLSGGKWVGGEPRPRLERVNGWKQSTNAPWQPS